MRGKDSRAKTKTTGRCVRAACKLSLWTEQSEPEPSTNTALKLFASMPSILQAHLNRNTVAAIPLKSCWLTLALFFRDQVEDLLAQRIVGIGGLLPQELCHRSFWIKTRKGRD